MLNNCLNTHLSHSRQWFNIHLIDCLFAEIAVFTDSPPNSHYDWVKNPPLSYSYSVPVSNILTRIPTARHVTPASSILPPDVRKRQRPQPPIPQESQRVIPERSDSRWIVTHGNSRSGRSKWYYRVEKTVARTGSESDLLEDEEATSSSSSTNNAPKKTFLALAGPPSASVATPGSQEPRLPSRTCTVTSRRGKVAAATMPPQRSFTVEPAAHSCRGAPMPRNSSSLRRQRYVGSGMRKRCGTFKRFSHPEPTSGIVEPGCRGQEEGLHSDRSSSSSSDEHVCDSTAQINYMLMSMSSPGSRSSPPFSTDSVTGTRATN